MRSCFVRPGLISFFPVCHVIILFVLFTAAALPEQSAYKYSPNEVMEINSQDVGNELGAIDNLTMVEANHGEPTDFTAPTRQQAAPSDIPSMQPSAVGKEEGGSMKETEFNPSFGTNRCGVCKINIDSISIKNAKIDLRKTRDTFLLDYTAGLKHMSCPTFSSTSCSDEVLAQELALQEYKQHTNDILAALETFDCQISQNQGQQSCPVEVFDERTRTSNVTNISQADELFDVEGELTAESIFFEETRKLTRVVRAAQDALDIIDELIHSLFGFGGASTGGVCTSAISEAKSAFSATKLQLLTELSGAHYILTEKEAADKAATKNLVRANYIATKAALRQIILVNNKTSEIEKKVGHLSNLVCPFGKTGLKTKHQRQGCDGVDQNCNGKVDECDEDQVPPTITLAQPVPTTPFADIKSARDFLENNINVMDDCAAEIDVDIVLLDDPLCSSCKFLVRASDIRCGGGFHDTGLYHDSAYSQKEFVLPVVSKKKGPLSIKCGFTKSRDKTHVKDGSFNSCQERIFPSKQHGETLHIDETVFKQMVDVGLWYDIDALKKDGIIDVDIVVKSNELEGQPNDNTMVSLVVRSPTIKGNAQAMVFLTPTTCHDGFSPLSLCVAEETEGVTTRIYDIEITGRGADGATDTATCSVIVVPQNHHIPIKAIAAGTILVVGGIVAAELVGGTLPVPKGKKRRAVRQRGLQGENVSDTASKKAKAESQISLQDEEDVWYPPTNAPMGTASSPATLNLAPTGSPTTAAPGSPTLDPDDVQQNFEDDKSALHKQYKLSKWRFEVGSVSLKFDPKFDTVIKGVHEDRRRRLQEVDANGLRDYNPLC